MILYFSQLMSERGKVVASHPGYQAAEMNLAGVDPLYGTDTGGVGWLGSVSQGGAAVTMDAARAERKREASMPLGRKEGTGRTKGRAVA